MKNIKYIPIFLIASLPSWALNGISSFFAFLVDKIFKYRQKVITRNLTNSFPDKNKAEIDDIRTNFYRHFTDTLLESIQAYSLSKNRIKSKFKIVNLELLEELYNEDRSIILYTAHFGNWEWLGFLPLYTDYLCTAFYQPLSNGYFDGLIKTIRERFGVVCIPSKQGFKTLLGYHKQNVKTINFIISDQSPQANSSIHWTSFLNQETPFLIGSERMAKKMNMAIVYPEFTKTKRGHYLVEFKLITKDAAETEGYEVVDRYATLLEESIKKQTELWLWSHRRWKIKPPQAV